MAAPYIRVDVWSLAPTDPVITYYADAVRAMRAKPATDVTSWSYQAAIHGTHAPKPQPLWNECRHGAWFFLPWHRAYVYYFERIVRAEVVALGGPATWALPYWNYDGGAGHNALPIPFRTPTLKTGPANPLFMPGRRLTGGAGLPSAATSPALALSRSAFTGASEFGGGKTGPLTKFAGSTGSLEQTPHNDIHNLVGGVMLDPEQAAEDPIFWLHHANIDRVWWLWQKSHPNPSSGAWTKPSFDFFDVGGTTVSKTGPDVEDTVGQLDYTYSVSPTAKPTTPGKATTAAWPAPWPNPGPARRQQQTAEPDAEATREMIGATGATVQLVGQTVRVAVPIDARATQSLTTAIPESAQEHRAFLEIENVDAERNPGAVYGVYVNLPNTPSAVDLAAHHVGNVSLFGVERARSPRADKHPHTLRFSMEITDVLNRLATNATWKDGRRLDITFRPLTLETDPEAPQRTAEAAQATAHPDTPIRIGRISVHYQ